MSAKISGSASARMSTKSAAGAGSNDSASSELQQGIAKLQADLVLLTQKMAELSGTPQVVSVSSSSSSSSTLGGTNAPSSPFVSGLRGMVGGDVERLPSSSSSSSSSSSLSSEKLALLEKVMLKITELDRMVLKKTVPVAENGEPLAPARRASRGGGDLFSLPTHLHVTDRLMDLHTQSRRVVTITRTAPATAPSPAPEKDTAASSPAAAVAVGVNKAVQAQAQAQAQVDKAEERRAKAAEDCKEARKECLSLTLQLKEAQAALSVAAQASTSDVGALEERLAQSEAQCRKLQEAIECDAAKMACVVNAILSRANSSPSSSSSSSSPSSSSSTVSYVDQTPLGRKLLPEEVIKALVMLDASSSSAMQAVCEQLGAVNSVKEMLEMEMRDVSAQNDLLKHDLAACTMERDAVTAAYHSLQGESVSNQTQEIIAADKKLKAAMDMCETLQAELAAAARRTMDLERLPAFVAELEAKQRGLENTKMDLDLQLKEQADELLAYKKLCETLKQKLRDLSGSSDNREFLDSFEEVMREEMMTMKSAFEAKLRAVKEAAEDTSRRHAAEITRIHSTSPHLVVGKKGGGGRL